MYEPSKQFNQQALLQLEAQRKKVMGWTLAVIVVGVIGFLSFLAMPFFGFVLFLGAILSYALGISRLQKQYATSYKRLFVEGTLMNIFTDVYFDPERQLPEETIANTEMMSMGNRYFSNDYIRAKYKGIWFEQADVRIQQVTRSGKHTHTTTYFEGRWMIFEFNKHFAAELQVKEKGFSYAKKSGGWFSDREKMHKLELEDEEFNRMFTVNAVNDQETYYILTPHMMERIKRLRAATDGELLMCFVDNRLHVAVNNRKNAFEPSVFSKINPDEAVEAVYGDIRVITQFIEEMQLDNQIFKGGI